MTGGIDELLNQYWNMTEHAVEPAKRILVCVFPRSHYWTQACEAPDTMGEVALDILKKNGLLLHTAPPRLMAASLREKTAKRDRTTDLVFDIFHDDYQPENGHLPGQGELPMLHIRLTKTETASVANPRLRRYVNESLRVEHDVRGIGSVPPFIIDYTKGLPGYNNLSRSGDPFAGMDALAQESPRARSTIPEPPLSEMMKRLEGMTFQTIWTPASFARDGINRPEGGTARIQGKDAPSGCETAGRGQKEAHPRVTAVGDDDKSGANVEVAEPAQGPSSQLERDYQIDTIAPAPGAT